MTRRLTSLRTMIVSSMLLLLSTRVSRRVLVIIVLDALGLFDEIFGNVDDVGYETLDCEREREG